MAVEHINKQIYDKQFENDERELMYNLLIEGKLKKMKPLMSGFEGKILDVGCGNCWTNQLLAGTQVEHFGIDISDNALRRAEKKGAALRGRARRPGGTMPGMRFRPPLSFYCCP